MIIPLTFVGNDAALVEALRAGHPGAAAALYDRHAARVRRTLRSIMGPDDDIPDLLQEVFIRALREIGSLREFDRLSSWLCGIAVYVARAQIRARTRRRYLRIFAPAHTHAQHVEPPSSDARQALREIYAILDDMPVNHRMAFVLRYIHGTSLVEAAEACGTSLATIKRWLGRAEKRFVETISQRPALEQWLKDGTRWTTEAKA